MMTPSIFGENLFDDWMNFSFPDIDKTLYGKREKNMMKTDVKDTGSGYEIAIDLPGFKKEDLSIQLNNGYLTISAAKGIDKDETDKDGRYIRRERYSGSMSRSFYIGSHVTEQDIHAKYDNGILTLDVPKEDEKAIERKGYIAIEG